MRVVRAILVFIVACRAIISSAQPGWRPLKVEFELYHNYELIQPEDLQRTIDFQIRMQGSKAEVSRSWESTYSLVAFGPVESDVSTHHDTLWMEIAHNRERMRIGFPPRMPGTTFQYTARGLRIDFKPGTVMVTDLPKRIHLRGTIDNAEQIRNDAFCSRFYARMGENWARSISVDLTTGRFDGTMDCTTIMHQGSEWVEAQFVAVGVSFEHVRTMIIRMPYSTEVDLDTITWVPTRFRLMHDGMRIETALPRDTVIGDPYGSHLIIGPINPTPSDTMKFEFIWNNSGQPHVASQPGLYMKDCCTVLADFSFAVRTDTDVMAESWMQHAEPFVLKDLPPGKYRLRQVPAQGEHLLDVDFLLNKDLYFTVGERTEP